MQQLLSYCMFQIDSAFYAADQFFQLSYDVKDKYSKTAGENPNGWDAIERER